MFTVTFRGFDLWTSLLRRCLWSTLANFPFSHLKQMNYFSTILLSLKFNLDVDYKPKINVRCSSFTPLLDRVRPQLLWHLCCVFPNQCQNTKNLQEHHLLNSPFQNFPWGLPKKSPPVTGPCVCLSSQTMVIPYQSLISSFLSGRVAVGGTQLLWLTLFKTAFEKWWLWEWDWMMSDWENFLYKSSLISSAQEIELFVFLAGMLQFPLCVWAQWVCKCYFHQVFALAVIFSLENKQALQLLKKKEKKKRQEKYLLHYSFLKNVVSKLCVFSPNHKISYSGSNLEDCGKFLSSPGDRSAYLKGMPFSLFYFVFVLFLALTGLGIVF